MLPECVPLGECAVLLRWGNVLNAELNRRIVAFGRQLTQAPFAGFREAAPAYCSLTVYYDPLLVDSGRSTRFESVAAMLSGRWQEEMGESVESGRVVEIPVRYGGEDLTAIARAAGFTEDEVVEIHAGRSYRVYMMGFLPGFAYMGEVDERIAAPRHRTPRVRVEAGSVGIAGRQTGIYPLASPGGWQIIGRAEAMLFDPDADNPTLLEAGDEVRFVAI